MNRFVGFGLVTMMALALPATAAEESYQMTGPVVSMDDAKIVIEKEGVSREFKRDADTRLDGTPKVGNKVTVHYKLVATSVELKDAGKDEGKKDSKAPAGTAIKK